MSAQCALSEKCRVQCRWMDGTDVILRRKCIFVGDIRRQVCDIRACLWHDVVLLDDDCSVLSQDSVTLLSMAAKQDEDDEPSVCVSIVISKRAADEFDLLDLSPGSIVIRRRIVCRAWRKCLLLHAQFGDVSGLRRLRSYILASVESAPSDPNRGGELLRDIFYEALMASIEDSVACEALCVSAFASVNAIGGEMNAHNGRTALEKACEYGVAPTVAILLKHGAQVEATYRDRNGALHWASIGGHQDIVKMLLDHGASIHAENNYGNIPLHWAARSGHAKVCALLLEQEEGGQLQVNLPDNASLTSLHWAAWEGHVEIVRTLISYRADVNLTNRYGNTALHWACRVGRTDVARLLVDAKASPLLQNEDGRTCLHDAVFHDHPPIVEILMKAGANPHLETNSGKTALCWARGFGREMMLLLSADPRFAL